MINLSNVINSDISYVNYVATSGDKLYYTNYDKHTVTCCVILTTLRLSPLMDNVIDNYYLTRMVCHAHVYLIMTDLPIGY